MINMYNYLYVEDDALSREAMALILRRVMKVKNLTIFENSMDFMARLKALPHVPNIFLLDIHMEPHTGFEMLKMLKEDKTYAKSRMIALTASVMNEEVKLLRDSGFHGVIGKPINVAQFPALVERIVRGESVWHISEV